MSSTNRLGAAFISVALGMGVIGFVDNFVRRLAEEAGLWQFHATRSAIILVTFALLAAWRGWRVLPRRPGPVMLRGLIGAASMILYFGSVAIMPIAEVGAGLFTAPIFVLLITVLVYRERVGPWRIGAVALGFAGVLMVLQPGPNGLRAVALLPVAAGFLYALAAIATRRWCAGESVMTLNGAFFLALGLYGLAGLAVLALWPGLAGEGFFVRPWVVPSPMFWKLVALQAAGSMLGVGLLTRGYQLADASYVAVFEYAFLVSAGFWAWVLWGEVPDMLAMAGILSIVLAGVVIILRSPQEEFPPRAQDAAARPAAQADTH